MRKLNTILSVLLLFICLLHGLMGSFMLCKFTMDAIQLIFFLFLSMLYKLTV